MVRKYLQIIYFRELCVCGKSELTGRRMRCWQTLLPQIPLQKEREVCMCVNCTFVLWDGWGFGLFRAVFDEPAGPPCVLAKVLMYNQLQEMVNQGFLKQ